MEKTKKAHNSGNFVKSALIISIGGLIAKLLGAVYRIPLTNLLGSYGMGLYQLVFPPYILIMILATGGIPVAISKLVAYFNSLGDFRQSKKIFDYSLIMLFISGLLGSILLFLIAKPLATMQGSVEIETAYKVVAPSILFVTLTSGFRGFFQGNMRMFPVSLSQIMEQIAKLVIGLLTARFFLPDINKAVLGALFAVTISEFVSFVVVFIAFLLKRRKLPPLENSFIKVDCRKEILKLSLPVLLGGFILQVAQLLDSVMIVNLISNENATNLYGLWTGPVNSLLGLPITLSYGVAVSALPSITQTYVTKNFKKLNEKYNSAFKLTLVIAIPSAFGLFALSRAIISLLYGNLPLAEIETASKLLTFSALSIIFLSILQTMMSVLQALGKPYVPVFILVFAILVKFVFNWVLLPINSINIFGAAISETMCFAFASLSAIMYLKIKMKLKVDIMSCIIKPLVAGVIMLAMLTLINVFAQEFLSTWLGTFISIIVCATLYFALLFAFKTFNESETNMLTPKILQGNNKNEQSRKIEPDKGRIA